MASYVVMVPPAGQGNRPDLDAAFVRDGFAFLAFFLPVLWLLWHRLWVEAVAALVLTVGIALAGNLVGFVGAPLLSLLVSIYFGLEAGALRISGLRRRGWREAAVVEADSREDAETRYLMEQTAAGAAAVPAPPPSAPSAAAGREPVGLLLNPGRI
ncbi:MAG: DUF2628 domain-containing protein [Mesorhizobium sp.]